MVCFWFKRFRTECLSIIVMCFVFSEPGPSAHAGARTWGPTWWHWGSSCGSWTTAGSSRQQECEITVWNVYSGSTQPFIYGWGGYLFFLCQVIVQRVHIDGLCRTKDDLLTNEISGIFGAKNLIDVCSRCWHSCRQTVAVVKAVFCCAGDAEVPRSSAATLASGNLQESGSGHRHLTRYHQVMDVQPHLRPPLFSSNNTYLLPEEARMRFPTAWMWRLRWLSSEGWRAATTPWWETTKAAWSVAHCSSCIPWWFTGPEIHDIHSLTFQVLGVKLPNVFGRAETVSFQFSYGTKETSYGLSLFKPQQGNFERKWETPIFWWHEVGPAYLRAWCLAFLWPLFLSFSVTISAYKVTGQFPWSSLREMDRGVSAQLTVNLFLLL